MLAAFSLALVLCASLHSRSWAFQWKWGLGSSFFRLWIGMKGLEFTGVEGLGLSFWGFIVRGSGYFTVPG